MLGSRHRQIRIDLRVLVAGRDEHPVDADLVGEVPHHLDDVGDLGLLENRRVRRHAEAARARRLDRVDRDIPEAGVVADVVVDLPHPVEMHDERHARGRLEPVEALLEPQRVRAELDGLAKRDHSCGDLFDPLVDERLAAADRDDRRRALDARVDALLHRQPRAIRFVLADLPAADARDVACERGLEHENERIPLTPALLGRDVLADRNRGLQRKLHPESLSLIRPSASNGKLMRYRW